MAVLSTGSTLAAIGLTQAVPRFASRYDDPADLRGTWLTGLVVACGLATVTAAVLLAAVDGLSAALLDSGATSLLVPFLAAIPFYVAMKIGLAAIRGHENTVYKVYVGDLLFPLSRVGLAVGFLLAGFGAIAAGYACLTATVAAAVVAHFLLHRLLPLPGPFTLHAREMVRFAAPLVASVVNVLLTRTDTLMIGYFDTSVAAGLYGYGYPLATGLLLAVSAFGYLYLPLASRLDADGDHQEMDTVYKLTAKWGFVLTFPGFLTFIAFPENVLAIFFGPDARPAALAFSILSVGFFTSAVFGFGRATLSAMGDTDIVMGANVATFVSNVLLNLLLIPRFSYVGAAVASGASYAVLNLIIYGYLRYSYGFSPFSVWAKRTFVAVPAVLCPFAFVVSRFVDLSVLTLPVFLAVAGLLSLAVFAVSGLQSEDDVVISLLERRTGADLTVLRRRLPLPNE